MNLLEFDTNLFEGILPKEDHLPDDPEIFRKHLQYSLRVWTKDGYKVVWLKLPLKYAVHVPVATSVGFNFHHAAENYVMMTIKLVEQAFIPPYATHYIGAGGVVVNNSQHLLVVREKVHDQTRAPFFKLPGGQLQTREHLETAVVREVLEETGILTSFKSVACFRNMHGYRHGKSDIYFVCRLDPISYKITIQEAEIEECIWMPIESYYNSKEVSTFNKSIVRAAMESPGLLPRQISNYNRPSNTYEFFLPKDQDDPWLISHGDR